ncbi:MAG: S8 family serine peptidase [Bacteriovoracaceae bacterium]|nr:S8 family serine peptidase [Bacteriovoracaceae bacterium]
MKRISLLVIMSALLASCGKELAQIQGAPQSQNQAGIIASCTTKEVAQSLATTHGFKYRVINKKAKLIEFVGISSKELKKLLPKAKLTQNIVYDKPVVKSDQFAASSVSNTPFYGAHTPSYRNSQSANYFDHLSQIEAASLGQYQGQGVTIAIVDTGVYYNHPHLSPNIKTNPSESHGSNADHIDNDGNGLVDDYAGWDFYNNDAYPIDDNGHGTHVAGLAAGTLGGIAPKAKILPIKVLNSQGSGDLGTIAQGILYAIDMNADIINLSLGGNVSTITSDVQNLINVVVSGKSHNTLMITASGNGGSDGVGDCNDAAPVYPANINSNNVISVGAVNSFNRLTSYSNFGQNTVHIAAPGGDSFTGGLLSTDIPYCNGPCNEDSHAYTNKMGTSMATPIVSGLAALIKSKYPNYTYLQIRELILNTGVYSSDLDGFIQSKSVVNVKNALQ